MIFRILLLINLISCVCGTFVVNVTQSSYQAEENHNITLEWTFTTKPDSSSNSIFIYCALMTNNKNSVLFHLHDGVEVSESQDEQFSGRVQFDKDVLREGRIRLQLSRLRTEDSGLYRCKVRTDDGENVAECRLSVTEAADQPETQRPAPSQHPERRGGAVFYTLVNLGLGLGLAAVVAAALLVFLSPNSKIRALREKIWRVREGEDKRMD